MRPDSDAARRRRGGRLVLSGNVDCQSCGAVFDGTWTDDSDTIEDMAEAPVAEQECPECGARQSEEWPGWMFRSEAG